ncbi:MAG: hypothetical protein H6970_15280 [Gammaproteobacteria bacterium]|nr:hypothetical protein [Gammaproteobacteria bacterium]
MSALPPWTRGPFELLIHGEVHLREGADYDRRIAMISYDNAVEVAITTYLELDPLQRGNRHYATADVTTWLRNYHTKLDFFEAELNQRGLPVEITKAEIVWFHKVRNNQYHGGNAGIPEDHNVQGIRKAAFWVFSVLFEVSDLDESIQQEVSRRMGADQGPGTRDEATDDYLDDTFGLVTIAGREYRTSDALRAVDFTAYRLTETDLESEGIEEESEESSE